MVAGPGLIYERIIIQTRSLIHSQFWSFDTRAGDVEQQNYCRSVHVFNYCMLKVLGEKRNFYKHNALWKQNKNMPSLELSDYGGCCSCDVTRRLKFVSLNSVSKSVNIVMQGNVVFFINFPPNHRHF